MSHYTVAVFHRADQDIEDLLAPYDENMDVEPYVKYTRQAAIDYARAYLNTEGLSDDECWKLMANGCPRDADGNIYSTYNPKSKWDWWVEGGRYSGMLKCNGQEVDSGRVGDLDFMPDEVEYQQALAWWDREIAKVSGEPEGTFYKTEYYLERYGDRETYAREMSRFSTYAVITPDGEWHAPGDMGWFGCSSESAEEARDWYNHYKERFIDTADPDWILTIVDCHI